MKPSRYTPIDCQRCGRRTRRTSSTQKWCPECKVEVVAEQTVRHIERNPDYRARQRAAQKAWKDRQRAERLADPKPRQKPGPKPKAKPTSMPAPKPANATGWQRGGVKVIRFEVGL